METSPLQNRICRTTWAHCSSHPPLEMRDRERWRSGDPPHKSMSKYKHARTISHRKMSHFQVLAWSQVAYLSVRNYTSTCSLEHVRKSWQFFFFSRCEIWEVFVHTCLWAMQDGSCKPKQWGCSCSITASQQPPSFPHCSQPSPNQYHKIPMIGLCWKIRKEQGPLW